tara:strand:+ start:588 stop:776 length:189 start_codon:yes stop_codon:yes gene_type:complete
MLALKPARQETLRMKPFAGLAFTFLLHSKCLLAQKEGNQSGHLLCNPALPGREKKSRKEVVD